MSAFKTAYPTLSCKGKIKQQVDDFVVEEAISFEPTGEGEHLFVWVEKTDTNTFWLAKQVARWAGVKNRLVNIAGQKDRHGRTRQWLSIHLPGQPDPDLSTWNIENCTLLKAVRHNKALKSAALTGNGFEITIRDFTLNETTKGELFERLETLKEKGVPNYFGPQRFGLNFDNLPNALRLFANDETLEADRFSEGMYVSAARSVIFNQVLSKRIEQQNWVNYLSGDVIMLNGRNSFFDPKEEEIPELAQRLEINDIHLSGPMVGDENTPVSNDVLALENQVIDELKEFDDGLATRRLKHQRRALRMKPENMTWELTDNQLKLYFQLPSGSFATSLIREIIGDD